MATPEEMSISLPIRRLRRPETLPTTKTTTTRATDDGGGIIMKAKKKRAGSFLCFGPPATGDIQGYDDEKERADVDRSRNKKKRLMAKIVRSISMKSSSSRKLTKETSRLTSRKVSDSSENPLASESFGKNSDALMFSSSSPSSSSSFSSSSSSCSSVASPMAAAVLPKLQREKTFMPPPGPSNREYATGLTLVLFSLFVMVFCGRLTAFLWTATWLCLLPRRRTTARRPPEFAAAEEAEGGLLRGGGKEAGGDGGVFAEESQGGLKLKKKEKN